MAGEWEYEIVVYRDDLNDNNQAVADRATIVRRRIPTINSGRGSDMWREFCWADRHEVREVIERLRLAEITPVAIPSPADVNLMKENERLLNEVATRDQELREMQALMNDTNARFAAVEGKVAEVIGKNGEFEVERIGYERRIFVLEDYISACVRSMQNLRTGVPDREQLRKVAERNFNAQWKAEARGG